MAAHVHYFPHKGVSGVVGVERLDLRVLGSGEVVDVVALDGLIEKRQSDGKNESYDENYADAETH